MYFGRVDSLVLGEGGVKLMFIEIRVCFYFEWREFNRVD